jgi:hypothetical protein
METNTELYIRRATEFEAKAFELQAGSLKDAFLTLARDYRILAAHVERTRL